MKKAVLSAGIALMFIALTGMACGCSGAKEQEEVKEEIKQEEVSENEPEAEPKEETVTESTDADEEMVSEIEPSEPAETEETASDVSENEPDTVEDILAKYAKEQGDFKYLMYDVDADGFEELFIMSGDSIVEIYGNYKGKMRRAFSNSIEREITLYPGGMIKAEEPETAEDPATEWYQYYGELGDYLPVFEEYDGQYYTFCAYKLSAEEMDEINRALEDTGYYPVWVGEWSDEITKKEYDGLISKEKPINLPAADDLSDRSALETKSEYLCFVKAPDGYVNLRTGPGTEYEIIREVPNGEEFEVYLKGAVSESGKTWLKVAYFIEADNEDGYAWLTGWVAESQLE